MAIKFLIGLKLIITVQIRMNRYCLTLDLKDEPGLIEEYTDWHKHVWPEVLKSIKQSGVIDMEIYRFNNRLFMIMETETSFSFEQKALIDAANNKVKEWEDNMWKYQQQIPGAKKGEKWMLMTRIFSMCEQVDANNLERLSHG